MSNINNRGVWIFNFIYKFFIVDYFVVEDVKRCLRPNQLSGRKDIKYLLSHYQYSLKTLLF